MPWKMDSQEQVELPERTPDSANSANSSSGKAPVQEPSRRALGVLDRPPVPQAWIYGSTGGSLPCAQSWHPAGRLLHGPASAVRMLPPQSAWTRPSTPRTVAVPAACYRGMAGPQAARPPGHVVVVRELSPGRPMAYAAHAAPQAVSPTSCSVAPASGQSVQSQGQMSPPVLRPRSLSPTPAARPPGATPSCPQTCQPTPRMQSSNLGRFAGAFPTGYVSITSPRRERSLSPVGLPPVPVLSGVGAAAPTAPAAPSPQKCLSPRTVIVRHATPRASTNVPKVQVLVTPRAVPAVPSGKGLATPGGILEGLRAVPTFPRTILQPHAGNAPGGQGVRRAASHGAVKAHRTGPAVLPPKRPVSGVAKEPFSEQTAAGQLPPRGTSTQADTDQFFADGEKKDAWFLAFNGVLSELGAVEATCQQLLARLHSGPSVRWEELVNLDPVVQLLGSTAQQVQDDQSRPVRNCQGWWRALLARHGLYGPGNAMGVPELTELVTDALRFLRDRHAPEAFLRNLRTVHSGSKRLKELYGSFEFHARGMMGKSYRCRSRLTREEHICRQVCKDKVAAPSDLVRAEVEMLRSLEHPSVPQVIASFEDFNNIYIVLEPVESIELVNILQQWHQNGQGLSVGWLAEIARQLLEAFRHCHEMRPRSRAPRATGKQCSLGEVPTELGGDDTTVKKSHPRDPPPVSANVLMGSPQTEAEQEAQRLLLDKVILELSVLDLDESRGRLGKGVQFSDENEVFAEQQELLLRELLLTTPRPTLKLLTSAAELAFQDGDKGVIENFSKRVVSTSQFLFQKLQQSSSMKKLKPAVRRLIQTLRPGPQGSKPAGAPRVTVKAGKFLRKNCEAEKEVEVATVLWRKSLDSKPKAKAKGRAKAKAKAETAKSKKAAKKRAAKKPPVAAPAEEPEEEDDEIAEEPLVRKKPACIIRRALGHGSTAASLKRPAAAPADGEDSDDHPHRFAYMWYKNEAIGLCKYWRSRKSTGIKRKQLTNFRQKGWSEDRLRKAGEACVQALANETIAAKKEEIDAFMARYVQEQEG
eukprot:s2334_g2.t1